MEIKNMFDFLKSKNKVKLKKIEPNFPDDNISIIFTMPRTQAKELLIDIQNTSDFHVTLNEKEVRLITNCIMQNEQEVELGYGK